MTIFSEADTEPPEISMKATPDSIFSFVITVELGATPITVISGARIEDGESPPELIALIIAVHFSPLFSPDIVAVLSVDITVADKAPLTEQVKSTLIFSAFAGTEFQVAVTEPTPGVRVSPLGASVGAGSAGLERSMVIAIYGRYLGSRLSLV